ncbi:MAG: type II secretion system F family protein [Legionellales bacterium]|jgi:type IV pilus assembly protein PilC
MNKKIYRFSYQGWDHQGHAVHDHIEAEHILIAKNNLESQGYLIKKIKRTIFTQGFSFNAQDLLRATQQLTVLINASLPLVFCLTTLGKPFKNMVPLIQQGKNLTAALQIYSHLFPYYFIYLIQVGEESGQLGKVLGQLATYQEKMLIRAQQFKKALLYPTFVFSLSLVITLALLIFIVPQFQLLFANVTEPLPPMTQFVFHLSDILQKINMMSVLVLLIISYFIFKFLSKNNKCMQITQDFLYYLPLIGKIIHDNQQTRYLRSLSVAMQAGLPLIQSLQLAAQVMVGTRLSRKITSICEQVASGLSLKQSFTQTAQFSDIVVQLIAIGEQTSCVPVLLAQCADVLEQHVDQHLQRITSLLQPILIVGLGIILGSLIIALYLPVFKLGTLY